MAEFDEIPTPCRDFTIEHLEGETILYRHSLKKMIYLNESAAVVWTLCDGRRTVADIVDLLVKNYPGVADTVAADVKEVIADLTREGALETEKPKKSI